MPTPTPMLPIPFIGTGRDWLDIAIACAEIIGALATAAAFWITWYSLREMRRQTNLANNPRLKISFRLREELPSGQYGDTPLQNFFLSPFYGEMLRDECYDGPHDTWNRIIAGNLQHQDISGLEDEYLILELSNAGKSEINEISFKLSLEVRMFDGDVLGYEIEPKYYEWPEELTVELSESGGPAIFPITNTRYFPIYSCEIADVTYRDVRGTKYRGFAGSPSIGPYENEILRPQPIIKEPEEGGAESEGATSGDF